MILVSDNQPSKVTNPAEGALDHIASPFLILHLYFARLTPYAVLQPFLIKWIVYRGASRSHPALVGIA